MRLRLPRMPPGARCYLAGLAVAVMLGPSPRTAQAQRPFLVYDPFYREEKAGREFYDRFALSAEIVYIPAAFAPGDGLASIRPDPIGYGLRVDYQLAEHFDLGIIVDAFGSTAGRSLGVSWLTLKYYRIAELGEYAVRLAIDPAGDGQGGFPQIDAAFIYTSLLSPEVSTDFAIGMRRVRVGYERHVPLDGPEAPTVPSPILPGYGIILAQALGWEVHGVLRYNAHFDPAGSHIYFALLAEAGSYEMIDEPTERDSIAAVASTSGVTAYRGGVVWLRSGFNFSRPGYAITPFVALPVTQWAPDDGDWPGHRMRVGVRAMLR